MATRLEPRRWTYEEFAKLPDDGNRYEIIAGELYVTPAPRTLHQKIVSELTIRLGEFVRQNVLGWVLPGPIDVLFAEGDYLEPDLVFVRRERKGIITDRGLEAAPELVVEVLSPSTSGRDRGIKRERYAYFGVQEYWVADAERKQVEVYRMMVDPTTPEVVQDRLRWKLHPYAPELEIDVPELLKGFE
jgi:Uma2 family endonuclease